MGEPKLYGELAPWFHVLMAPEDYAEEAELYRRLLVEKADGPIRTVLELGSGSGGGNNASHLKRHFQLTLVDRSPGKLGRVLNPELEHVEGDMRTVRLDRTFDAVFVHDARRPRPLGRQWVAAVSNTAWRSGSVRMYASLDYVQETFEPRTSHGGHDSADGVRGLRYVEWVRADPSGGCRV
jgi:hypothetical protein